MHKINNSNAEALPTGRMILPRHTNPPAEVSTQW